MATYKPLQSVSLTSNTAVVSFSDIDQNYTDLVIVCSFLKSTGGSPRVRFNSDNSSSTLYSQTILYGNGTSALSGRETSQNAYFLFDYFNPSTTNFNSVTFNLFSYSNTTIFKTILEKSGVADVGTEVSTGLYRSTNAISSITINADGGSGVFGAGTTFDLYGIKAGTPKAVGGDVVTTDGTYWYHAFKNSGTLDIQSQTAISADILVVAGGGGGGANNGAGGGGGGVVGLTSSSLLPGTSYTATIGAGGGPSLGNDMRGINGGNSQFGNLTAAVGGGGGGSYSVLTPGNGGSGGGGGANAEGGSSVGGSPTSNQGFAGGNGQAAGNPNHSGGGGGGAGAAGANASAGSHGGAGATFNTSVGGTAGPYAFINAMGTATGIGQLSSSNYYFAGGGGGAKSNTAGGNGGLGGGGNGGGATVQSAGTANTGGGGGGNPNQGTGAITPAKAGGSGVIIVRYLV
jgi:hypothetical protein